MPPPFATLRDPDICQTIATMRRGGAPDSLIASLIAPYLSPDGRPITVTADDVRALCPENPQNPLGLSLPPNVGHVPHEIRGHDSAPMDLRPYAPPRLSPSLPLAIANETAPASGDAGAIFVLLFLLSL